MSFVAIFWIAIAATHFTGATIKFRGKAQYIAHQMAAQPGITSTQAWKSRKESIIYNLIGGSLFTALAIFFG